jgi:hypothetical protein
MGDARLKLGPSDALPVGAGNSVRRSDLLVFGSRSSEIRVAQHQVISRFARGDTDLVSNRSTSARATRTGLHKDPVSR